MLWGGELMLHDGRAVGQVTSAAWGQALGSCVGLAYVNDPDAEAVTADWLRSGGFAVNVGGRIHGVQVGLRAPYDPDGTRIRP
jgi:glycine cleavage system aminomethyltransferase T